MEDELVELYYNFIIPSEKWTIHVCFFKNCGHVLGPRNSDKWDIATILKGDRDKS